MVLNECSSSSVDQLMELFVDSLRILDVHRALWRKYLGTLEVCEEGIVSLTIAIFAAFEKLKSQLSYFHCLMMYILDIIP